MLEYSNSTFEDAPYPTKGMHTKAHSIVTIKHEDDPLTYNDFRCKQQTSMLEDAPLASSCLDTSNLSGSERPMYTEVSLKFSNRVGSDSQKTSTRRE